MILMKVFTGNRDTELNVNLNNVTEVDFRDTELIFRFTSGHGASVTIRPGNRTLVESRFNDAFQPLQESRALTLMGFRLRMNVDDLV